MITLNLKFSGPLSRLLRIYRLQMQRNQTTTKNGTDVKHGALRTLRPITCIAEPGHGLNRIRNRITAIGNGQCGLRYNSNACPPMTVGLALQLDG